MKEKEIESFIEKLTNSTIQKKTIWYKLKKYDSKESLQKYLDRQIENNLSVLEDSSYFTPYKSGFILFFAKSFNRSNYFLVLAVQSNSYREIKDQHSPDEYQTSLKSLEYVIERQITMVDPDFNFMNDFLKDPNI